MSLNFLKTIDILGHDFKFSFEKSDTFKTNVGGVVTILVGIGVFLLCVYFSGDMFVHKNPNVIMMERLHDDFPTRSVNESNFFFAYNILDYNYNVIYDKRYFEFLFEYELWEMQNITGIKKEIISQFQNPIPCKPKHLHYDNYSYYKEKIYNFMCLENPNYEFGGDWSRKFIKLANFMVKRCDNTTELKFGVKCASDEELKEKFKDGIFLSIYYEMNVLDPQNYEDPIKPTIQRFYLSLDLNNILLKFAPRRKIWVRYNHAKLVTDNGFWVSDYHNRTFFQFDEKYYMYGFPTAQYFLNVRIHTNRRERIYFRSYIKTMEVLGNVGGLVEIAIYPVKWIYGIFLENSYKIYMFKKLFKLQFDEDEDEDNKDLDKKKGKRENQDEEIRKGGSLFSSQKLEVGAELKILENISSDKDSDLHKQLSINSIVKSEKKSDSTKYEKNEHPIILNKSSESCKEKKIYLSNNQEVIFRVQDNNFHEIPNILNSSLDEQEKNGKNEIVKAALNLRNEENVEEQEDKREQSAKTGNIIKGVDNAENEEKHMSPKANGKDSPDIELHPALKLLKSKTIGVKNPVFGVQKKFSINLDKDRKAITPEKCERIRYKYCCLCNRELSAEEKLRYELLKAAEKELHAKTEIVNFLKTIDQFKFLEKLLLNEDQYFMLQGKSFQSIPKSQNKNSDQVSSILNEKYQRDKEGLIEYLREEKLNEELDDIDRLLLGYLDEDLRQEIRERVEL